MPTGVLPRADVHRPLRREGRVGLRAQAQTASCGTALLRFAPVSDRASFGRDTHTGRYQRVFPSPPQLEFLVSEGLVEGLASLLQQRPTGGAGAASRGSGSGPGSGPGAGTGTPPSPSARRASPPSPLALGSVKKVEGEEQAGRDGLALQLAACDLLLDVVKMSAAGIGRAARGAQPAPGRFAKLPPPP